jgi:hypothetical protein
MYNFLLPTNQPTTFNSTQSHSSINRWKNESTLGAKKSSKMLGLNMMMTIMIMIRDVRDPRNKCVKVLNLR